MRALTPDPQVTVLADRLRRNDGADQAVRGAVAVLGPLIQNLPTTDDLLLDERAVAAWRTLRDRQVTIYLVYRKAVFKRCGAHLTDLLDAHVGKPPELCAYGDHPLKVVSATELSALELPRLEPILEPWLTQKTLGMVHAKRGVGKTHLALAVAHAIATGGRFLCWQAPQPRGVLYIDGEMPAQLMQQRVRELGRNGGNTDLLQFVTPDLQDSPMPDLGTLGGQRAIDSLVDDKTGLLIVDNLSCLVRSGGAENESESWSAVSEWALAHRRDGRAVIFIHHSGKSGAQRGTSRREDLLDVVICLRRPVGYSESDGAVFVVDFEKSRSVTGDDIAPIEARLETLPNGALEWTYRSVDVVTQASIVELWNGGAVTLMDVARELALNKSTAHRQLERAMADGKLTRPYPTQKKKAG